MSVVDQAATRNYLGVKFQIDQIDYDTNSNALYVGIASQGAKTSEAKWIIYKYVYDGSNRYTGSLCAGQNQIWDNRGSLVYT